MLAFCTNILTALAFPPVMQKQVSGAQAEHDQSCCALFGYPTLDSYTPLADTDSNKDSNKKHSNTSTPRLVPLVRQQGKRRSIGPPPAERQAKRSPLDSFGDAAVRSKDHFGHLCASVKAHLPRKQLKDTGLLEALDELQSTVASDMKRAIDSTWRNGVSHGEWLKTGEARQHEQVAASADAMRQRLFELEVSYMTLNNQYTIALQRIKELYNAQSKQEQLASSSPRNSPSCVDYKQCDADYKQCDEDHKQCEDLLKQTVNMQEIQDLLADEEFLCGLLTQPPSPSSDDASRQDLTDVCSRF